MEHRIYQHDGTHRKKTQSELVVDTKRVLQAVREFPTLPTIYANIIKIISSPETTVSDLSRIIEQDQSASTKILRVANSPIYGIQTKVTSLNQAIFYLGFNEIKNLMISLTLLNVISKSVNLGRNFNLDDFWRHTIAVGVIARQLGFYAKCTNLDDYLLAGIVHDIGKLVFIKYFPEIYGRVSEKAAELNCHINEIEKQVFGITNQDAGYVIAEKWNLPPSIKRVTKYQSIGISDVENDYLTAAVHIGNIMAKMMLLGNAGDLIVNRPNPKSVELLNLPENSLLKMYNSVKNDYIHTSIALLT